MTLEELIYSRLADNAAVRDMLTEYGGRPALFLQRAPDDTAQEWGTKKYPRAEYLVDMVADPERHSSGVVSVHIYSDDAGCPPEDIAPAVRKALCDIIMQADDGAYCITWERTELFDMEKNMSPNTLVNGCSLTFLLIAFPAQITKTPDPALAMQDYLKELEPEALVINKDHIESVFEPSLRSPAFYVRVQSSKTNRETYALTWVDCMLSIHVIAPEPEMRNSWSRYLADSLQRAGEVMMLDDSPMLIFEVSIENAADYLTRGQITVKAQYSIPRLDEYAHPLKKININKKEELSMATKKSAEAAGSNEAKKAESKSVYTVNELAKASRTAFGKPYSPDIVRAAMVMAGKTEATKSEAAEIINKFLGKDKEEAR